MFDPIKNFAKVSTTASYTLSSTEIVLLSGQGSKLPAPSTDGEFNLVWWNRTDYPDPSDDPNVEIVRCTARVADTLTITRAQESTVASDKNIPGKIYLLVLTFTKSSADAIIAAIDLNTAKNSYPSADATKLTSIESGATADQTAAEIKTAYENNPNTNNYTDAEKTKLAGLDASLFLGVYTSLGALQTAHASPVAGSFAYVDAGVGSDIVTYVWDDTDNTYVQLVSGGSETPASIKSKYESNADTNAYSDSEKTKLAGIEASAEVNNMSDLNANALVDTSANALHYHDSDRARANHTGTQPALTISDFDTEVGNHSDVAANTAARHTHANKATLDKFGEDIGGLPTYNGVAVDTTIAQRDVYNGLDSIDNTISLSASQGKVLKDVQDANKVLIDANTAKVGVTSEIRNLVEDTTPQLGGDLDVNGQKIVSASNGNIEIAPHGTGDFSVNTDDLFVDTSSGNVGIGTTAPSERLSVAVPGTGMMLVGDLGFGNGFIGLSMNGTLSTSDYNLLSSIGQGTLWINRPIGGDIYFREGNHNQVVIKAITGNVGIGTIAPNAQLHTTGSVRFEAFGAGTLQTDANGNVSVSSANNTYPSADATKVGHLTVTQAVNLDQMEIDIAALANGMVYSGNFDASFGTFPSGANTGSFYYVTVAGTIDGLEMAIGDTIVATTDNASTTVSADWSKHDNTAAVQSVVGLEGSITKSALLAALNVEDGADATDAVNVGSAINVSAGKTTPVDADTVAIINATGNVLAKVTWANVKATLKTYFDSLYQAAGTYLTPTSTNTLTNKTLTDAKIIGAINAQTGTTYTLVLTDASKTVTMNNVSANTLTVPPDAGVAFPVGTRLMVRQKGAGATTIAAGSGVTINNPDNVSLVINKQHSSRRLEKEDINTWVLI